VFSSGAPAGQSGRAVWVEAETHYAGAVPLRRTAPHRAAARASHRQPEMETCYLSRLHIFNAALSACLGEHTTKSTLRWTCLTRPAAKQNAFLPRLLSFQRTAIFLAKSSLQTNKTYFSTFSAVATVKIIVRVKRSILMRLQKVH